MKRLSYIVLSIIALTLVSCEEVRFRPDPSYQGLRIVQFSTTTLDEAANTCYSAFALDSITQIKDLKQDFGKFKYTITGGRIWDKGGKIALLTNNLFNSDEHFQIWEITNLGDNLFSLRGYTKDSTDSISLQFAAEMDYEQRHYSNTVEFSNMTGLCSFRSGKGRISFDITSSISAKYEINKSIFFSEYLHKEIEDGTVVLYPDEQPRQSAPQTAAGKISEPQRLSPPMYEPIWINFNEGVISATANGDNGMTRKVTGRYMPNKEVSVNYNGTITLWYLYEQFDYRNYSFGLYLDRNI